MSQIPPAGWHPDPAGSGGWRYWNGQAWTNHTRPAEGPHGAPAPAPAAGSGQAQSQRSRRFTLLAGGVAALLLLGGLAFAAFVPQRGAASPQAALDVLIDAIDAADTTQVLAMVAPDELDALEPLRDPLSRFEALASTSVGEVEPFWASPDAVDVVVDVDPPRMLTEGVYAATLRSATYTIVDGDLAAAHGETPGVPIEAVDAPQPLVFVEQSDGWFLSPVGSVLQTLAEEERHDGAGPPVSRSGASTPEVATQEVVRGLLGGDPGRLVRHLDPEEVSVVDHYLAFLEGTSTPDAGRFEVEVTQTGAATVIDRIAEPGGEVFDAGTWCLEDGASTECLPEWVREEADPIDRAALEPLVDPEPLALRVPTVQRDGAHYVSVAGFLDDTVATLMDRYDDHRLAMLVLAPWLSPQAVPAPDSAEAALDVPLHDGWNVVLLDGASRQRSVVCFADEPARVEDRTVDGRPVRVEHIDLDGLGALSAPAGALLISAEASTQAQDLTLRVRVVEEQQGC